MAKIDENKFIKLHASAEGDNIGESIWAIKQDNGTAKINNVPLTDRFGFNAIVEYDSEHEITKVVDKGMRTVHIRYDASGTKKELLARYRPAIKYLEKQGLITEGVIAGILAVGIPFTMTDEAFMQILSGSPMPFKDVE